MRNYGMLLSGFLAGSRDGQFSRDLVDIFTELLLEPLDIVLDFTFVYSSELHHLPLMQHLAVELLFLLVTQWSVRLLLSPVSSRHLLLSLLRSTETVPLLVVIRKLKNVLWSPSLTGSGFWDGLVGLGQLGLHVRSKRFP